MAHYNTIFSQMLKIVPRHELEACVRAYQGDKWVKHFSCWNQFVALLFFQMTGRKSLRDLVLSLSSKASRLYHLGFRNPKISRSTLSDANRRRPTKYTNSFFSGFLGRSRDFPSPTDSSLKIDSTPSMLLWWISVYPSINGPNLENKKGPSSSTRF